MQLFSEYLQPITLWIKQHPNSALIITFFIAFAESLAIIGSIIPGSVTMTAIGILAGSGFLRIDLTLIAAILGATAGDGVSYFLGSIYRDRIHTYWPFKNHPQWLNYGKDYFERHGGKSVLIGRFIGPLRSLTPIIAGMMNMSHWRFFTANFLSAIGWSLLYVLPGVLIGAAGSELSPESATRLFMIILLFLGFMWLLTLSLKWLLQKIKLVLNNNLHNFWKKMLTNERWARYAKLITPSWEKNHYKTACLGIFVVASFVLYILIIFLSTKNQVNTNFTQPIDYLLHSLHNVFFSVFFIVFSEFTNILSLGLLFIIISYLMFTKRGWRAFCFWVLLNTLIIVLIVATDTVIRLLHLELLVSKVHYHYYPNFELTWATAEFSFLIFYSNVNSKQLLSRFLQFFLIISLLLVYLAKLYLGDIWLLELLVAFFGAMLVSSATWLAFKKNPSTAPQYLPISTIIVLLSGFIIWLYFSFPTAFISHQTYLPQHSISERLWWNQTKPILPLYRINRVGKPSDLFNIQYAGSLSSLERILLQKGWVKKDETFLATLINRINHPYDAKNNPLIAQLYSNRKPALVMTLSTNSGSRQIVRIWRSNYYLQHFHKPIWIGSVDNYSSNTKNLYAAFLGNFIGTNSQSFTVKKVSLESFFSIRSDNRSFLLLINESSNPIW